MPTLGWRWLLGLSTIPLFIFSLLCWVTMMLLWLLWDAICQRNKWQPNPVCSLVGWDQWLPESARYDVLTGNQEKALATLKRIATENGAPMPLGKLVADRQVKETFCRTETFMNDINLCCLFFLSVILIRRNEERFKTYFLPIFAGPQCCCGLFGNYYNYHWS